MLIVVSIVVIITISVIMFIISYAPNQYNYLGTYYSFKYYLLAEHLILSC